MTGRRRDEGGFTLVELLVVIAILAIITGALTEALIQGFRLTDTTGARVARSSALQAFTTFVTDDIHRAETVFTTYEDACVTNDAGRFLRLSWTEDSGTHVAVYALDPVGDGDHDLVRWECAGGGGPVARRLGRISDPVGSPPAVTVTGCKAKASDASTAACSPAPNTPGADETPAAVVLSLQVDPVPVAPSPLTAQRRVVP